MSEKHLVYAYAERTAQFSCAKQTKTNSKKPAQALLAISAGIISRFKYYLSEQHTANEATGRTGLCDQHEQF